MSRKHDFSKKSDTSQQPDPITQSSFGSFVTTIKELSATLAGIVGLAYGCGFLVTTVYLYSYGISDFSIVNARYVYSGAMFVLLCFMSYITAWRIYRKVRDIQPLVQKAMAGLWLSVLYTLLLSSMINILLFVSNQTSGGLRLSLTLTLWLLFAILTFCLQIWYADRREAASVFPVTSAPLLVIMVVIYALSFYPLLSISLGGGQPTPVRFLIDDTNAKLVSSFLRVDSGNLSPVLYMIDQSPETYFVLIPIPQSSALQPAQIARSLVAGVVHPSTVPLVPIIASPGLADTPSPPTAPPLRTPTPYVSTALPTP